MRLIADSGSTKTDWALVAPDGSVTKTFQTGGINPVLLTDEEVSGILSRELCPALEGESPEAVCFYGAGCRPDQRGRMSRLLAVATGVESVEVESDLLGACRALCGDGSGICCILGTGSASCLYDGGKIVQQTPSLGYILGDEGSGTALGRRLLADVLKGQLPKDLCEAFLSETGLNVSQAIEKVYRRPWPNRFMASFAPFLAAHLEEEAVKVLVEEEMLRFVRRNLLAYGQKELPVSFVGSVAHHFQPYLEKALTAEGLSFGRVERRPLPQLVKYHSDEN